MLSLRSYQQTFLLDDHPILVVLIFIAATIFGFPYITCNSSLFRILYQFLSFIVKANSKPVISVTPWGRVVLEKVAFPQLVKKFSAFYGTQSFITVLPYGFKVHFS
jgi:hypothetical protein